MNFTELIQKLEKGFSKPLPGKNAHLTMAPNPIDPKRFDPEVPSNHRKGAVLILFYPDSQEVCFPLIKRPSYEGVHSGQIAFPGGKYELEDANLEQTALREAQEEVGVDPSRVEILGEMTSLFIPPSNFLVSPFIGITSQKPEFVREEKEVDRILLPTVKELLSPSIRKEKKFNFARNLVLDTPYFEIDGEVVWGATAMMLSELLHLIDEG
ncbi:NUDIX hydrolase [Algoriphagus namhaensis]|uniref:NUDIX hydrolase n=1 Tax=Algoriphagus namhaensis TaxID=915353 RepID=A0ABV8AUI4_9BACT